MTLELLKSKTKDLAGDVLSLSKHFIVAFARQTSTNDTGFGQS
jgi:hypothetical protein